MRRGFHSVVLLGATDEDALDMVHSYPLSSKNVHSISLRCSSVSDRGLETLLDHLQVRLLGSLVVFHFWKFKRWLQIISSANVKLNDRKKKVTPLSA